MSDDTTVHITYEVEEDGKAATVELPFVIGVLADLRGAPEDPWPPLPERKFVTVDRDNLDAVLADCEPRLAFLVENQLQPGGAPLPVELRFRRMTDFEPEAVARQVPGLLEALIVERPESSRQLDEILHAPAFQRLEASWRGLQYLLWQIRTSAILKVRVLNASKLELLEALREAPAPNRSAIFRKVHDEPYGTFAEDPFAILIGDYDFSYEADDLELLEGMAASAGMFGVASFAALSDIRNVAKIFQHCDHARWRSFRDSADAAYAALVVPRMPRPSCHSIRQRGDSTSLCAGPVAFRQLPQSADARSMQGAQLSRRMRTDSERLDRP